MRLEATKRRILQGRGSTTLAFVLGLVIATAGTATAAKLITGKQIKDGSISAKDLSAELRAQLAKTGSQGPKGEPGAKGDAGAKGDPGALDNSGSYTKAESDARYARVASTTVSDLRLVSVPSGTTLNYPKLVCPAGTNPGKGRYATAGFPANTVVETLNASGYEVAVVNAGGSALTGALAYALSCIGIDPSGAPVPALPAFP